MWWDLGWLLLLLLLLLPVGTLGKGHLELSLVRYDNKGLNAKQACDGANSCSLYFLLQLDGTAKASDPGATWDVIETDVYKNFNTSMLFGQWTNQRERNPIERSFEVWKGILNLHILVRHSSSYYPSPGDVLVDNLTASIRTEADTVTRQHTIYGKIRGRTSSLEIELRVACREHYFLRDCSRHCEPKDDNYYGHFYCTSEGVKVCRKNWRDLESKCLERDFCAARPCRNQGVCMQTSMWDYRCKCPAQFTGINCERLRPPCDLYNPCRNGGTCQNAGPTQTKCLCPSGWAGATCSEDRDECLELPCRNGGHCRNRGAGLGFECDCLGTGFEGPRCEKDENECTGSPCRNNGTCTNLPGGFRCQCHPPFYGKDCTRCNSTQAPQGVCPRLVDQETAWATTLSSALVPAVLVFLLLIALLFVILLRKKRVLCSRNDEDEEADVEAKVSLGRPAFQNNVGRKEPNGRPPGGWTQKFRR